MDFGLSDEQRLLADALASFLEKELPPARVREIAARDAGHDAALWRSLCEQGAAGVLVPEAFGGSGLTLLDACVAAQALGYAAAPTPFLSTAVMAPVALDAASPALQREWLPAHRHRRGLLLAGGQRALVAARGRRRARGGRPAGGQVDVRARRRLRGCVPRRDR